ELYELDDFHVELGLAAAHGLHGGLHPLDVAAMIGPPNVDHAPKSAIELGAMIGDIRGKIGKSPVRFAQRPIDVVAECCRTEQSLLAVLPVLDRLPFRRGQSALVDQSFATQLLDQRTDRAAF